MRVPRQSLGLLASTREVLLKQTTKLASNTQMSKKSPDSRIKVVQGRGGFHMKRTLPSFSLEGKVAVVTGGARGLGLVMGQALVQSGADLAIVDLNS